MPATGKSAIAEGVARALHAPVFSVDPLEAVLLRLGIDREARSDLAAYDLAAELARSQLALGQSAMVDAVNGLELVRDIWRSLAAEHGVPLLFIVTVCSDETEHRRRLETRRRSIEGFPEPTWADVAEIRASWYEPFQGEALVLDAMDPLEWNLTQAIAFVTVEDA